MMTNSPVLSVSEAAPPSSRRDTYNFDGPPLAFVHIPRTGGTSLIAGLDSLFPWGTVCPAHDLPDFLQSSIPALAGYRLYRAHLGPSDFAGFATGPFRFITFVRDPVKMLTSVHRYTRRLPVMDPALAKAASVDILDPAYSFGDKLRLLARRHDLLDFVERMAVLPTFFNPMTMFLTVGRNGHRPDGVGVEVPSAASATAVLDGFQFVGITERYDESIRLLNHVMGWPQGTFPHLNGSIQVSDDEKRLAAARDLMRRLAGSDLAIYDYAQERFEREWRSCKDSIEAAYEERFPRRHGTASSIDYHVDHGVLGTGWLPRCIDTGNGGVRFHWSQTDATLDLPLWSDRDVDVEIDLYAVSHADCLQDFSLRVNGVEVPLTKRGQPVVGYVCTGRIPKAAFAGSRSFSRLEFHVPVPRVIDASGQAVGIGLRGVRTLERD